MNEPFSGKQNIFKTQVTFSLQSNTIDQILGKSKNDEVSIKVTS